MASVRKYAHLLDIDDSPDVYESAEPAAKHQQKDDDADVPYASDSDAAADPSGAGISRSRLRPDDARNKFDTARVDASKANFSDRVDLEKQSYIVSSRRRREERRLETGHGTGRDFDSEEDETDDGLARRIARLNREIEEVRQAIQRRDEVQDTVVEPAKDQSPADLASLIRALDSIQISQRQALSAHARLAAQLSKSFTPESASTLPPTHPDQSQPEPLDTATLSKLTSFDTRLAALESALGLDSTDPPATAPILPTLSLLDKQISLLTSPAALTDLQAKLSTAQSLSAATAATMKIAEENPEQSLSPHDLTQLRALHAALPTLTQLSPTVGPLLTRLKSLRYLHTDAAGAQDTVDALERRQGETEQELRAWREGLASVEEAVARAEAGFKVNADEVEKWVGRIEESVGTRAALG